MICPLSRAHIYVIYFPKKRFIPSPAGCFLMIFSRKRCEGLLFQPFTSGARISRAVKDVVNDKMMLILGSLQVSPRVKAWGGGVKG